jgi:hypothetical protein
MECEKNDGQRAPSRWLDIVRGYSELRSQFEFVFEIQTSDRY